MGDYLGEAAVKVTATPGFGVFLRSTVKTGCFCGSAGQGDALPDWRGRRLTAVFRLRASYFLLLRQKKVSKEKATPLTRLATPTPLRYSPGRAAAELGATPLKQSSPTSPGLSALLTASDGGPGKTSGCDCSASFGFCLLFTVDRKITPISVIPAKAGIHRRWCIHGFPPTQIP